MEVVSLQSSVDPTGSESGLCDAADRRAVARSLPRLQLLNNYQSLTYLCVEPSKTNVQVVPVLETT